MDGGALPESPINSGAPSVSGMDSGGIDGKHLAEVLARTLAELGLAEAPTPATAANLAAHILAGIPVAGVTAVASGTEARPGAAPEREFASTVPPPHVHLAIFDRRTPLPTSYVPATTPSRCSFSGLSAERHLAPGKRTASNHTVRASDCRPGAKWATVACQRRTGALGYLHADRWHGHHCSGVDRCHQYA